MTTSERLAGECPVRLCPHLHQTGEYRHYLNPKKNNQICCFHYRSEVPGEFVPTDAQHQLWEEQNAKEI